MKSTVAKAKSHLSSIGPIGIVLIAIASPCCFPLFGAGFIALGLGSFELLGSWTPWVIQGLVVVSLVGTFLSYSLHKNPLPLAVGLVSAGLIFYAYHIDTNDSWRIPLYIGVLGMLASAALNFYIQRKQKTAQSTKAIIELRSTITCPECGYKREETMPTNACQLFYECNNCHHVLKPKQADCCVFCSYGTAKCPPVQLGQSCC